MFVYASSSPYSSLRCIKSASAGIPLSGIRPPVESPALVFLKVFSHESTPTKAAHKGLLSSREERGEKDVGIRTIGFKLSRMITQVKISIWLN